MKQYQEAKREIDLSLSISPETYSSYYYLGKILKENKDYGAAIKAFEKAISIFPEPFQPDTRSPDSGKQSK